jgi:hypothetical protein
MVIALGPPSSAMCDQQMDHLLTTQRMVLIRQKRCGTGIKKQDILKVIEIVEENMPIMKLEIKCQVSHKIHFFLPMMDLTYVEVINKTGKIHREKKL